ncbi:MAG: signal peptidase II, partial [Solirubrobacterales bacterium]|nr:signal peptidase II [Solirubrobacterales bacterium]
VFAGVHIVRVHNSGIAFGMLEDAGSLVIVIAAIAFAALLSMFLLSAERRGLWLPVGLLAGGALGNLIDRLRHGYVTDFIDPPRWPAFNVADIEITVGVILLVAIYVLQPEPEPKASEGG